MRKKKDVFSQEGHRSSYIYSDIWNPDRCPPPKHQISLFSFLSFALCSLFHFLYPHFRETSFQCHSLLGKDKQTKSGRLMTCFSVKKQSAFKEFDLLFKTLEIIKCLLTKQNTQNKFSLIFIYEK